ncbi:hypothetical protein INT45_013838 [Circinella minor]|uniref:OTU domain-containing protein n=1 Tax=Circinella minor TaxID=1195481 RepID=A0A8H7VFA0_9FUNG|nr:hypothetical protein INT45_013838 [Circinella minor]
MVSNINNINLSKNISKEILDVSNQNPIGLADERSIHLLNIQVKQFTNDDIEHMAKDTENGTNDIMQHIMNIKSNEVKEDKAEENKVEEASVTLKKQRRVKNRIRKESQKTTLIIFGLLLRKPTEKKTSFVHPDIPTECSCYRLDLGLVYNSSVGLKTIKSDGYCGYRALALQLHGDQNQYTKVKQTMLSHLNANYEFYRDILCNGRDNIMNRVINRLEFGIIPETAHHTSCSSDYWFDALRDSQIAADAYTTPIAVFMGNTHWKSVLYLPFTIPSDTNRHPQPLNLFHCSNHFSMVDLIPSRTRYMEWPSVRPYHKAGWDFLGLAADYKTT